MAISVNSPVCIACQRKRISESTDLSERRKANRSSTEAAPKESGCTDGSRHSQTESDMPAHQRHVSDSRAEHGCQQASASAEVPASILDASKEQQQQQQQQQQATHLLMKACEREEHAEERAETAEDQLRAVSEELRKAETRAEEVEALLAEALERVKLMELRVLDRCSSRMSDSIASEVASDTDSNRDSMDRETDFDFDASASGSEDADNRPIDHHWINPGSQMAQLLLEVESLSARLTLTQKAEAEAKLSTEASLNRLESFAEMVRGCAAVAFAGSDSSSRRLRHHLFRCLDIDADGFVGELDVRHWYDDSMQFLDAQGCSAVTLEALRHQLADALHTPDLPPAFASQGKISLMQLSRSKMGAGIICTLLNIHNMMQERSMAEWGAARHIVVT